MEATTTLNPLLAVVKYFSTVVEGFQTPLAPTPAAEETEAPARTVPQQLDDGVGAGINLIV